MRSDEELLAIGDLVTREFNARNAPSDERLSEILAPLIEEERVRLADLLLPEAQARRRKIRSMKRKLRDLKKKLRELGFIHPAKQKRIAEVLGKVTFDNGETGYDDGEAFEHSSAYLCVYRTNQDVDEVARLLNDLILDAVER